MTITVEDVINLKNWREDVKELQTLELIDAIMEKNYMRSELDSPVAVVQYIMCFDELIKRLLYNKTIGTEEARDKKKEMRDCISDEARKLLRAVE